LIYIKFAAEYLNTKYSKPQSEKHGEKSSLLHPFG